MKILSSVTARLANTEIAATLNKSNVAELKKIILTKFPDSKVVDDNVNEFAIVSVEPLRSKLVPFLKEAGVETSGFANLIFYNFKDIQGSIRFMNKAPGASSKYTSAVAISTRPFDREAAKNKKAAEEKAEKERMQKYERLTTKLMPVFKTWGTIKYGSGGYGLHIETPLANTPKSYQLVSDELEKLGCKRVRNDRWEYADGLSLRIETRDFSLKTFKGGKLTIDVYPA